MRPGRSSPSATPCPRRSAAGGAAARQGGRPLSKSSQDIKVALKAQRGGPPHRPVLAGTTATSSRPPGPLDNPNLHRESETRPGALSSDDAAQGTSADNPGRVAGAAAALEAPLQAWLETLCREVADSIVGPTMGKTSGHLPSDPGAASADSRVRWDNPMYGLVTLPGAFREILAVQQHQGIGLTAGRGGSRCAEPDISVMKQQRVEALGRCRH